MCIEIPKLPDVTYNRVNPFIESSYPASRVWNVILDAMSKHTTIVWRDGWSVTAKKDDIMLTAALFTIDGGLRVDLLHNAGCEFEFIILANRIRAACAEIDRDAYVCLEDGELFS